MITRQNILRAANMAPSRSRQSNNRFSPKERKKNRFDSKFVVGIFFPLSAVISAVNYEHWRSLDKGKSCKSQRADND